MYLSMVGERRKRLYPKPVPKLQGIVFPVTKKGDRSTTTSKGHTHKPSESLRALLLSGHADSNR